MACPPNSIRQSILKVLDCMRDTEVDLVTFMEAILTSNEPRIKNVASGFLDRGGFEVVSKYMLRHLGFTEKTKTRHPVRCLSAVNQALGPEVWQAVGEILEQEIDIYCKSAEAGKSTRAITSDTIEKFSLIEMRKHLECHCPQLSRIMRVVCPDGMSRDIEEEQEEVQESEEEVVIEEVVEDVLVVEEEVAVEEVAARISTKRRLITKIEDPRSKKRRAREKSLIGTVCLGILAFGHSRNANLLQIIMGYYLQGYSTAKEVISVLNRLGLTVSYNTICELMNTMATRNWEKVRRRIQEGEAFGYAIDNCVIGDNKAEQSVLNRKETLQYTAGFLWFLNLPEERLSGMEGSPSVNIPEVAVRALGGTVGKGIDRKVLFRGIPDYEGIDGLWALSMDALSEYIPMRAVVHLSDVLWEFMPEIVGKMEGTRPTVQGGYQIPLHRSEVHGMKTQPFDEATIPGISDILDASLEELDINTYEAMDRGWLVAGDLFTLIKIEALQNVRVRDFRYNRHEYVIKLPGAFHLEMAAEDALFRAHWGREDGMDPGSLCHLKHVLGVKGITATKAEYNTCKRFTSLCAKGFALAAFCEILEAGSFEQLKAKLQERGEYISVVEEVVKKLFVPRLVRVAREKAEALAQTAWDEVLRLRRRRADRAPDELSKKAFLKKKTYQERDLVYENYLLFLQQGFGVKDLHWNIRNGQSGGFWRSIQMLAVWFNGCGKHLYGKALIDLMIDRKAQWEPTMEYVWDNNIFLNLSGREGKWQGVDKVNEFVVRRLKDQHNPRGNWQSKEFFLNVVSKNVFLFDAVKKAVKDTSKSIIGGKHHSSVSDYQDVFLVLKTLLAHKVNQWQKGRFLGGGDHNKVEMKEALDLFTLGEERIIKGGVVEEVMRRRNKGKRALEFGRDFAEADAGYDEESGEEEELLELDLQHELNIVCVDESMMEEIDSEEENSCDLVDLSAEDLEGIQMNWSAWRGVGEFEVCSEGSNNGDEYNVT